MSLVVDDHALIDLLADMQVGWLRSEVEHSIVYTTGRGTSDSRTPCSTEPATARCRAGSLASTQT